MKNIMENIMDEKPLRSIAVKSYDGEGLFRSYDNMNWFVGIKNYKPSNDLLLLNQLERHLKSDEIFILLEGTCTLIISESQDKPLEEIHKIVMVKGKTYCVNQGFWHNTIMSKNAKLILVESSNTTMDNSEIMDFSL